MPDVPAETPLRIGFVLTPSMLVTGTALPYEMWMAAGDFRHAASRRPAPLRLHLIAAAATNASGRLALTPDSSLADSPVLDVVYLPALWRHPETIQQHLAALPQWLLAQHRSGAQIAAVSTGVGLLAATGLLDGRAATTHWYYFERFARTYPAVDLKRDFFITRSGSLHCAASINSLADVTVHLIERFLDRPTAQHVERNFSHEIRRSYAENHYLDGGSAPSPDELVIEAQAWIEDNLASSDSIADLARRLGVGVRTLERRFRAATGVSPRTLWQRRRIALAKDLLLKSNLAVSDIAWRVGYQDAGYFTRLFQREMLVTPSEYRQTVRPKLFRAGAPVGVKEIYTAEKQEKIV
ncbi:MAG: helix-turn-helix domain-containing protein [Gammaproteobacteria bacterium]